MRNNGLVGQVDLQPAFPTPSITVPYNGNGVAYAFVQRIPFCASDDVQVLVPKTTADVGALLFVCSVLRRERYRFSYGRKWHLERMQAAKIRLPSKNGQPDWERMASFVASLPFASGALDAGEAHVERGGLA